MPRPSIKSKRREEILDAAESCVARFGVEGTTLDKIADEANLARPLIRHNLGNRAAIMQALVKRFIERSDQSYQWLAENMKTATNAESLIDALFMESGTNDKSILVAQALNIAAASDKELAKLMRGWTDRFVGSISTILKTFHPKASGEACDEVSIAISGLYLSTVTFEPLNPDPKYRESSINMAKLLLGSLQS